MKTNAIHPGAMPLLQTTKPVVSAGIGKGERDGKRRRQEIIAGGSILDQLLPTAALAGIGTGVSATNGTVVVIDWRSTVVID